MTREDLRKRAKPFWHAIVAWSLLLSSSEAADRYVSTAGSHTAPYTNWATAATSIQAAIDASLAGDAIWVTNGVYTSTGPGANSSMINLTNGVTIKSMNGAASTVIDGGYPAVTNRCVYIGHAAAILEGFSLRNGSATGAFPDDSGGGAFIGPNGTLRNCLIYGNAAAGHGGGVYILSTGRVMNCTLSTNIAAGQGGGVYVATNATLQNCIVYGNAGTAENWFTNRTAAFTYCCATPLPPGTGNTASDPLFVDAASTNLHLSTNSPCINAGSTDLTWMGPAVDLDGEPRVIGGFVDIGADEYTRYFYVSTEGANGNPGTQASPWGTLRYAVTNGNVLRNDTIRVGEGTYVENLSFISTVYGLTIQGGYNTNDWTWAPGAHPSIIRATSAANDPVTLNANNLNLIGFTLTGGRYGILSSGGSAQSQFLVSHCIISNNASHGVFITSGPGQKSGMTLRNCLIAANGNNGIYCYTDNSSFPLYFYNCTIVNNASNGYYDVSNPLNPVMKNCLIAGNGGYGIRHEPSQAKLMTIASCCLYGNAAGDFHCSQDLMLSFSGSATFSTDPLFAGPGDYRLSDGSPCVGYGTDLRSDLYPVLDDLEGRGRSEVNDIGCLQSDHSPAARYTDTYVDASRPDDTGDGSSWETAKKKIGSGLAWTTNGTCHIAAGTYTECLIMPANVTAQGTNSDLTVVTGRWNTVTMPQTNSTLQSLTLAGGRSAVSVVGTANRILNCQARNGTTSGFYLTGQGALIQECRVRNNAYGIWSATAVSGLITIDRTIVSNNTSHGVYVSSKAGIKAMNSLFATNGGHGVAVQVDNGQITYLYNCTLSDNAGSGYYDGYNSNPRSHATNCVFSGNAGYGVVHSNSQSSLMQLGYNCTYGNARGNYSGSLFSFGAGLLSSDPQHVGGGDYHLASGSLCIDAGTDLTAVGVTNDLDTSPRSPPFDMGCYQSAFAPPPKYAATYADASAPDDGGAGTNAATAKKLIGSALAITTDSGTCTVAPGLYNESVIVPPNVILDGLSRTDVIITNSGTVVALSSTNSRLRNITAVGGVRGISLTGAGNVVENCAALANSESGLYMAAHNNVIRNCTFVRNGYGFYGSGSVRGFLDRCLLQSNTSHGIYLTSAAGITATNLLVANNGGHGVAVQVDNGQITYLHHCTIANNTGSGYFDAYGTNPRSHMTNCVVSGNGGYGIIHANNQSTIMTVGYTCVYGQSTNLGGTLIVAAGGMITNQLPLFKPGKYQFLDASPCIDAATNLGVNVDLSGGLRPVIVRWPPPVSGYDMGCYEFVPKQGTYFVVK